MSTETITRRDLETALIQKCWKDPEFKKQVISDPKGMIERYTGNKLPEQLTIAIHEEDGHTLHFRLPPAPTNVTELTDDDLERVAGGTDFAVTLITVIATVTTAISGGVGISAGVTMSQGW